MPRMKFADVPIGGCFSFQCGNADRKFTKIDNNTASFEMGRLSETRPTRKIMKTFYGTFEPDEEVRPWERC